MFEWLSHLVAGLLQSLRAVFEWLTNVDPTSRSGVIVLGLATIAIAALGSALWALFRTLLWQRIPGTEEYEEYHSRLKVQEMLNSSAIQSNKVVFSTKFKNTEVALFSGDITQSDANVIVSSDDTLLSASGGVARAIVTAAGKKIRKRLLELSGANLRRGSIAITEGGATPFTYIFHAVVLTKTRARIQYPRRDEISRLIQRIVAVADAIGVGSLAMPVLAGGTAAKELEGLHSEQDVILFIFSCLAEALKRAETSLETVFLIVFDNKHLSDDFVAKLRQESERIQKPVS
jgi:O-acetyl-ADP-ribose deacetylase (regulator of RNase III)